MVGEGSCVPSFVEGSRQMSCCSVVLVFPILVNSQVCARVCTCPSPPHPCGEAARLRQRVDGVDGRGGLGALITLRLVLVFLHRVLADEGTVLVKLSVSALAVVHQAVVALLHVGVQRRLATLKRLVVLVAAAKDKVKFTNTSNKECYQVFMKQNLTF